VSEILYGFIVFPALIVYWLQIKAWSTIKNVGNKKPSCYQKKLKHICLLVCNEFYFLNEDHSILIYWILVFNEWTKIFMKCFMIFLLKFIQESFIMI
jgi:hypothetical protein